MLLFLLFFFLIFSSFSTLSFSYNSTTPLIPFPLVSHPFSSLSCLSSSTTTKPFPTGAWWTNLCLHHKGDFPIYVFPYQIQITKNNQIHISYPSRIITKNEIIAGKTSGIILGFQQEQQMNMEIKYQIINYDQVSVTIEFCYMKMKMGKWGEWKDEGDGENEEEEGKGKGKGNEKIKGKKFPLLHLYLVQGSPYITIKRLTKEIQIIIQTEDEFSTILSTTMQVDKSVQKGNAGIIENIKKPRENDRTNEETVTAITNETMERKANATVGPRSANGTIATTTINETENGGTVTTEVTTDQTTATGKFGIAKENGATAITNAGTGSEVLAETTNVTINYTKIRTISNYEWMIFTSKYQNESINSNSTMITNECQWELVTKQQIQCKGTTDFGNILRIALNPPDMSNYAEKDLVSYSPIYPIGANISIMTINENTSELVYHWKTKSMLMDSNTTDDSQLENSNNLLMLSLPHQRTLLIVSNTSTTAKWFYMSLKGYLRPIISSTWHLKQDLPKTEWNFNLPNDTVKKEQLIQQLRNDIKKTTNLEIDDVGVYSFGKVFGRAARLALIADSLNQTVERDHIIQNMITGSQRWLNGTKIVYDHLYGGLIVRSGILDPLNDFGNAYYNDHHFHYGYLIYGFSVIGKFKPEFIKKYKSQVISFALDIGNPTSFISGTSNYTRVSQEDDIYHLMEKFPSYRHKDWYSGHSWASGLFPMSVGKSQESSSESINAYYSLCLFADMMLDIEKNNFWKEFKLVAHSALALDLIATKMYWHMTDHPLSEGINEKELIYEPQFSKYKIVGVLSALSVVESTWFGNDLKYVHGINMLPFTPISLNLFDENFMEEESKVIDEYLETAYYLQEPINVKSLLPKAKRDPWISFLIMSKAVTDPTFSLDYFTSKDYSVSLDDGASLSNTMLWIYSQKSLSEPSVMNNSTVSTDAPRCFGYSGCMTAGDKGSPLLCCNTLPGCCPLDAESPLQCCHNNDNTSISAPLSISPKLTPSVNMCHGESKCAIAGANNTPLDCCFTAEGCCSGNKLSCCQVVSSPINETISFYKMKHVRSILDQTQMYTDCQGQLQCATAGPNNTALECCYQTEGCCPGLQCCMTPTVTSPNEHEPKNTSPTKVSNLSHSRWPILFICIIFLLSSGYYIITHFRRRGYYHINESGDVYGQPQNDPRIWICVFTMLITVGFFIYLLTYGL